MALGMVFREAQFLLESNEHKLGNRHEGQLGEGTLRGLLSRGVFPVLVRNEVERLSPLGMLTSGGMREWRKVKK